MSEEKPEYEWYLQWSGREDTERSRAALVPCKTFNIWKDYILKVVTYEEHAQMIADGLIAPPPKEFTWDVKPGEWGLVCKPYYRQFERDWENMSNCYYDFLRGWDACEAKHKYLSDWAAAIEHEKVRNKWLKVTKRQFELHVKDIEGKAYAYDFIKRTIAGIQAANSEVLDILERYTRQGQNYYVVSAKCCGQKLLEIGYNIRIDYNSDYLFEIRCMPEDPIDEDRRDKWGHLKK